MVSCSWLVRELVSGGMLAFRAGNWRQHNGGRSPSVSQLVQQDHHEDRVYLTGLSMGGFGTWALAIARPDRFAAIAPICGGGAPRMIRHLTHIPAWVFHGAKDETVPLEESERMVEALKGFGGNVKLTVYPETGHDSWTETYDNPELYEWLLSQRRRSGV